MGSWRVTQRLPLVVTNHVPVRAVVRDPSPFRNRPPPFLAAASGLVSNATHSVREQRFPEKSKGREGDAWVMNHYS